MTSLAAPITLHGGQHLGAYRVDALIGAGGFSRVYTATHTALGSRHALKFLSFPHPELQRVLLSEGRIQARLRHPNIVQVTDVVRHAGQTGLVMELVDGASLEHWLRVRGTPPLSVALEIFAQILAAVEEAHAQGVLHCDLKPANVLMTRTSYGVLAKVADFGLTALLQRLRAEHAELDMPIGSPGYMAPEQRLDLAAIGPHTDVFALGAVLYELLSGKPALPTTPDTTAPAAPPPDLRVWRPDCPDSIADAVMHALEPAVEDRFPTVADLRGALFPEGSLGLVPVRGWPEPPQPAQPAPRPPEPTPSPQVFADPPWQRHLTAALVGVLVGSILIFGWWLGFREPLPEALSSGRLGTPIPPASNLSAAPRIVLPPVEEPPTPPTPPTPSPPPPVPAVEPPVAVVVAAPSPEPPVAAASSPEPPVAAAPSPELTVAVVPEVVAPVVLDVLGTWSGRADGRPFTLAILHQEGAALTGTLRVFSGTGWRTFAVQGRLSGTQLRLGDGGQIEVWATVSGDQLRDGTLRIGRAEQSGWTAAR